MFFSKCILICTDRQKEVKTPTMKLNVLVSKWNGLDTFSYKGLSLDEWGPHPCVLACSCLCIFSSRSGPLSFLLVLESVGKPFTVLLLLKTPWFFSFTSLMGEPSLVKSQHDKTHFPLPIGLQAELEETTHQIQPPHPPTNPMNCPKVYKNPFSQS